MRLVYDPVREGFLKPLIAAEPYVQQFVESGLNQGSRVLSSAGDLQMAATAVTRSWGDDYFQWADAWLKSEFERHPGGSPENVPGKLLVMLGIPIAYMPYAVMRYGPTNLLLRYLR